MLTFKLMNRVSYKKTYLSMHIFFIEKVYLLALVLSLIVLEEKIHNIIIYRI